MIPTPDQNATIAWLEAAGDSAGVTVDTEDAAIDGYAVEPCDHDTRHGLAEICTPHGRLCLACGVTWIRAVPAGETVSPEVLRRRPVVKAVAA